MHSALVEERSRNMASTSNAEYKAFQLKRQAWEAAAAAPGAEPVNVKAELDKWSRKYRESLARVGGWVGGWVGRRKYRERMGGWGRGESCCGERFFRPLR